MYQFTVKVRGTTFLWGSAGLTVNLGWPVLLVIRNDDFGEPVTFGTETTSAGSRNTIGTLQPGECYTIPLLNIRGVFASCDLDSTLACTLLLPHVVPATP